MSNQLFEAVPISEKPTAPGKYLAFETNHGVSEWRELRYDKTTDSWFDGADCFHPTQWLRPIQPSREAEQRAKELYPDCDGSNLKTMRFAQRAAYLKGRQEEKASEASTGQERTTVKLTDTEGQK